MGDAERLDVGYFLETVARAYGVPAGNYTSMMLRELRSLGVRSILSYGRSSIGGINILGRGWASIVAAVETTDGSIAAAKMLHPKSRRSSLLHEAAILAVASWANIAPQYYAATRHAILYRLVEGCELQQYTPAKRGERLLLVRRLLWKAYQLDILGISHNELARPHKQVLVDDRTAEPYIIDYESATITSSPSNLTQLIGGLIRLDNLAIPHETLNELRPLLSRYKKRPRERHMLYDKILGIILSRLD